jgi:hypothetical protein
MEFDKGEKYQNEILRRMTGDQRLEIAFGLYEMVRDMKRHIIRKEHPTVSDLEIQKLLAEAMRVE